MSESGSTWGFDPDREASRRMDEKRFKKQKSQKRSGRSNRSFWAKLHKIAFTSKDPVYYAIYEETNPLQSRAWSINLATLQRVRIHALRHALSNEVKKMKDSVGDNGIKASYSISGPVDSLLHGYCDAIRDLDYMQQRGGRDKAKDPFLISTSRKLDRALFYDLGLASGISEKGRDRGLALPPRSQQYAEERLTRLIERTGGAAASIAALFGPVLIMIFVPTLAATLTVAFAAVLLVVIAVAVFTELPANEVMTLSFTYAAVLVVFIGTTLVPDGSGP